MTDHDARALLERSEIVHRLSHSGPSARDLCDALGAEHLYAIEPDGSQVPAFVGDGGLVYSQTDPPRKLPWGYRVAVPEFSPERNRLRRMAAESLYRRRVRLLTEDMERKHDTTDHVLWKDPEGEPRAAPADVADRVIEKTGTAPGTHPKVWRPS